MSRDVEAYLDRKLAENRRVEAALAIGEPLIDGRGRALQPLQPQTINSHLHLLSAILARAVREGLLARNPAEGEEVRREKKYGVELDPEADGDVRIRHDMARVCAGSL